MNPMNVYAIVTPFVLAAIVFEFFYCMKKKKGYYNFQDSMMGLGTAIINQCFNLVVAVMIVRWFDYMYVNHAITQIAPTWYNYVLLYIGVDFFFYWFHRIGHKLNVLWAAHIGHHSGEELNYATALRTGIFQRLFSFAFYWPLAIMGFSTEMILPTVAANLVYQFLPHTRAVPKLPNWIESWLNTPSHHRVHHACNVKYIDKNFGGTLIIWDKMFGSYEEEIEEPVYGVTTPPNTWSPTVINFQYFKMIWETAKKAPYFFDKIKIWFMPLSWTPRGLTPKPFNEVTKQNQVKYQSKGFPGYKNYLLVQLPSSFALMLFVIRDDTVINNLEKVVLGLLIWMSIQCWSGLMESKKWAPKLELTRIALTALFLFYVFNRYHVAAFWGHLTIVYSVILVGWFTLFVQKKTMSSTTTMHTANTN